MRENFKINLIYLYTYVFIAVHQLSLVVVSGGYSLVAVQGFLTAVAPIAVEHGFQGM